MVFPCTWYYFNMYCINLFALVTRIPETLSCPFLITPFPLFGKPLGSFCLFLVDSYSMYTFVRLPTLNIMFMGMTYVIVCSLSLIYMYSFPLYATFILLLDIWAVLVFSYYKQLLHLTMYKSFGEHMYVYLLDIYLDITIWKHFKSYNSRPASMIQKIITVIV